MIEWFINSFTDKLKVTHANTNIYQVLEGNEPLCQPSGLLVLPHFAGAATPYMDIGSKGAIIGLTLTTSQREIYHGIMEGVCYEMLLNIRRLEDAGISIARLKATGGGANSKIWLQMKADIIGIPVISLGSAEAGGMGSAIMASVSLGLYSDISTAAKNMVSERETYLPRVEMHKLYSKFFLKYEKLYQTVRPLI